MPAHFPIPRQRLAEICRRYHIRKLSLYGSVLRDDFRPDSDVDVLIEFDVGYVPGLFGMLRIERELTGAIGRRVDAGTPNDLSRYFRQSVIEEAEVQYAR